MALNTTGLAVALQSMLGGLPTYTGAGNQMGDAIADFAATGEANGVPAVISGGARSALKSALGAQFAVVPGTAPGAATGIAAAITTMWLAAVFAGMASPPVVGPGTLQADLTAIFSTLGGDYASKASDIANAITAHANIVIVTFPIIGSFLVV